jgi:hypothetical protein
LLQQNNNLIQQQQQQQKQAYVGLLVPANVHYNLTNESLQSEQTRTATSISNNSVAASNIQENIKLHSSTTDASKVTRSNDNVVNELATVNKVAATKPRSKSQMKKSSSNISSLASQVPSEEAADANGLSNALTAPTVRRRGRPPKKISTSSSTLLSTKNTTGVQQVLKVQNAQTLQPSNQHQLNAKSIQQQQQQHQQLLVTIGMPVSATSATSSTSTTPNENNYDESNSISKAKIQTAPINNTTQPSATLGNQIMLANTLNYLQAAKTGQLSNLTNFEKPIDKYLKSYVKKSSSNSNLQKNKVSIDANVSSSSSTSSSLPPTTAPNGTQQSYYQSEKLMNSSSQFNASLSILTPPLSINSTNTSLCSSTINETISSSSQLCGVVGTVAGLAVADVSSTSCLLTPTSTTGSIPPSFTQPPPPPPPFHASVCHQTKQQQLQQQQQQEDQKLHAQSPMPKLNWANNYDLWQVMHRKDQKYKHDAGYLKRHMGIEPQMRAILLDWLAEIAYAYRLHRETWHLACEYMDRFMSCVKQQMKVDRLQLIGMTALFLAAKVEEIYPPKLKELASHMENYSNNNEDAISDFELFMLKTLNWEISPVTANTWLMTYLQIASLNNYYINSKSNEIDYDMNANSHKIYNTHIVMPLSVLARAESFNGNSASTALHHRTQSLNVEISLSTEQQRLNNLLTTKIKQDTTLIQQQFFLNNYMKSVTLLDLCMFDIESLRYSYSVLAASAMYYMISKPSFLVDYNQQHNVNNFYKANTNTSQIAYIVQRSTGYKMHELEQCIKWMHPYASVCKEMITEEKMIQIKCFTNVDSDDCHNIQLYYENLSLLVSYLFSFI